MKSLTTILAVVLVLVVTSTSVQAKVKWSKISGIPPDIADGDDDTQLTETQVDAYVSNNGFVQFWFDIPDIPPDIADGDDDTQLTEAQVDAYVSNNGYVQFWGDIPDIPAGFADGIDDIGGPDSDWIISDGIMYSGVAGNVGIGTMNPVRKLDVAGSARLDGLDVAGSARFAEKVSIGPYMPIFNFHIREDNNDFVGGYWRNLDTGSSSSVGLILSDGATGGESGFRKYSDTHSAYPNKLLIYTTRSGSGIAFQTPTSTSMVIESNGNVGIGTASPQGKLDVNGSIYQRGGVLHADYVFESDYELESLDEHSKFMWQNKHLPAIPEASIDEAGQEIIEVGAHRRGIVEELEKAHIYIEQLHNSIKALQEKEAEIVAQQSQIKNLQKEVAELKSLVKRVVK